MAAPSGPWPGMDGPDMAMPPQLVAMGHNDLALPYLRAVQMTHNYHFRTNRVGQPDAYVEVQLQDRDGQQLKTLRIPDPKASPAVRRRQAALVRWLTDDIPVQANITEKIPAPGAKAPELPIWEPEDPEAPRSKLMLVRVPEHELGQKRQAFRPSDWSLVVVRAMSRHLCRLHGCEQAEVSRHSKEAIPPRILTEKEAPPEMEELVSMYGRLPK